MTDRSPNPELLQVNTKAQAAPGLFAPKGLLQSWLDFSLDLLFPPRCAGRGKIDTYWCDTCHQDFRSLPFPPNHSHQSPFSGMASTAVHAGKVREAVQALKYENARSLAAPLAERLSQHLHAQHWTIDTLVPVPLHIERLKERGYNQAQLLAEALSRQTGIPCIPAALRRQRHTQSQVTMTAAERLTNVLGAFAADPTLIAGRQVLIIDDVLTTGATLAACGEALLASGAKTIYALTVTTANR